MTFQAVAQFTNRKSLCIGEITSKEAALADSPIVDGRGLYLLLVDNERPRSEASVLAKLVSEDAAGEIARFFTVTGRLEAA
ncbi:hypothetical protein [Tardibacter chloracetimidivorans]|uniref:hypothetical protein n=1 Tax=Tardibacter chloracetimidivorans TaxID=1921510 RepID=UPI0013016C42|nr:hypothetical protein [Tardibacter chloracetimidivorans]